MVRDRVAALARLPELIPGLLALATFIILASSQGGWDVTEWAPAGLFMLGLLAAAAFAYRARLRELDRANLIAVVLLAAFVAWSFASVAWAEVQGTALDGANRSLAYLLVYVIFSVVAWRADSAAIVLGLYSVGLAVAGAFVLADAAGSRDAALSLVNDRMAEPTGYPNAVAALFIGGFWPAAHLASRREVPWFLRGLLLASAGFLVQLALLPQSRASLIVIPFALIFYLLVTPNRIRAFIPLVLALGATALTAPTILDVYTVASDGGNVGDAFSAAADAMLIAAAALIVAGTLLGLLDDRLELSRSIERTARRIAIASSAAVVVAGIIIGLAAVGNPGDWLNDRWQDFKGNYDKGGFQTSRFTGDLGSGRYDFWSVGISDEFAAAPIIGEGADNFAVGYLEHRDTGEEPLYPHSLPIRLLAGTGIVGTVLFAGFLVAAVVAVFRTRLRYPDPLGRGVAAVALATAGYFFLHSTGDWLWTFAGITMPAIAWLGMTGGGMRGREPVRPAPPPLPTPARIGMQAAAALIAIAAVVSLALPWISARLTDNAASGWLDDPQEAYSQLDTARGLNPLSARPDLVAGTIAIRDDDPARAAAAFARAVEREPTNWYARLELGTLALAAGERARGIDELQRARELNPAEPLIATALRRARGRNPLTTEAIDRALLVRVCSRVGATQQTRYCTN
jgi:hypothetical protein